MEIKQCQRQNAGKEMRAIIFPSASISFPSFRLSFMACLLFEWKKLIRNQKKCLIKADKKETFPYKVSVLAEIKEVKLASKVLTALFSCGMYVWWSECGPNILAQRGPLYDITLFVGSCKGSIR